MDTLTAYSRIVVSVSTICLAMKTSGSRLGRCIARFTSGFSWVKRWGQQLPLSPITLDDPRDHDPRSAVWTGC